MRLFLILVFILLLVINTVAQTSSEEVDSTNSNINGSKKEWYQSHYVKESIVPVTLALGSLAIIATPGLKEELQKPLSWNWNKNSQTYTVNLSPDKLPHDYLLEDEVRYAPVVAAYAISLCVVKSKHRFIDRTAILLVSYVVSDFAVYRTKKLTKSLRPGRSPTSTDDYSFPSQHTAMAFIGATFLDHELGYVSPWISAGGYVAATWVGMARVANNDHWFSDVLMGAAYGIICTNSTYWAYDAVMKHFPKNLTMTPLIDSQQTGLYVCYKF